MTFFFNDGSGEIWVVQKPFVNSPAPKYVQNLKKAPLNITLSIEKELLIPSYWGKTCLFIPLLCFLKIDAEGTWVSAPLKSYVLSLSSWWAQSSMRKLETSGVDTITSLEKTVHNYWRKMEMALEQRISECGFWTIRITWKLVWNANSWASLDLLN